MFGAFSSSNRNFGHDNDTDDTLLDLQTPPITFSLNNMSNVSATEIYKHVCSTVYQFHGL